jgi:hypothetical protein
LNRRHTDYDSGFDVFSYILESSKIADSGGFSVICHDFDGERVQGMENAVARLIERAKAFSTDGPVENDRHAGIVIGPPAAGKSAIAEPIAAASAIRAPCADDAVDGGVAVLRGAIAGGERVHNDDADLMLVHKLARADESRIALRTGHDREGGGRSLIGVIPVKWCTDFGEFLCLSAEQSDQCLAMNQRPRSTRITSSSPSRMTLLSSQAFDLAEDFPSRLISRSTVLASVISSISGRSAICRSPRLAPAGVSV